MSTRQVLGTVGAVIGAYFFGPTGAQWGWAIGSAIGGAIDPEIIKGPSIGDLAQQTSQEGVPRPIVYGMSPPMGGNIIASGEPRIVKSRKSQGKGGPKVETESVFRTYAIGICEGPLPEGHGVARIWRNGMLVYDVRPDATFADNGKWLEHARFFNGSYTQDPSPDLEALFGVGTTPAHRGTVYMVVADEDLTDLRGAIPQFQFQVGPINTAPIYSDTILELHFEDEGSGPTYIYDSSQFHHDVTTSGSAQLSSARKVCGASSLRVGESSELVVPDDGLFEFGSGDFTLECWLYFDSVNVGAGNLFQKRGFTTLYPVKWSIGENGGMTVTGAVGTGEAWSAGTTAFNISFSAANPNALDVGEWIHVALERYGGIFTLFVRGVGISDTGNPAADPPIVAGEYIGKLASNNESLRILNPGTGMDDDEFVYMDDFVWTSRAKYHATNFTPAGCSGAADIELSVADVITDICERTNLPAELIDVSTLVEDICTGYAIIATYPAIEAIRALGQAYFFDCSNYDGVVHFVKRGSDAVATITNDDMLENGADESGQTKRLDSINVPRVLHLNYHDIAGGLATDKQTSERSGDRRVQGERLLQTAVVMDADTAARVVIINHKVMIEDQKGEVRFSLHDGFIGLVPCDVIFLQGEEKTIRVRLTKIDVQDGYQDYISVNDRQSAYSSIVQGIPPGIPTDPPSSQVGPTLIEPLDIHILQDADDGAGLLYYVAISGLLQAWQGAQVELSYDNGATYIDSATSSNAAIMGTLTQTLPDHPQAFPDVTHTLTVSIDTPLAEFDSTDLAGLMNGMNLAIVGNEIIQFADENEISEGIWEFSYLLRGRKGTQTQQHEIGERFVLLDRSTLTAVPSSITDIGRTLTFRATSFGQSVDSGTVVSMVYAGESQTERAPAYLMAHRDGDNMVTSWQGVARLGSGATVAQGARFAGYRVTFDDGSTSIEVDTNNQTITQDVSTLVNSPITISVVQLNSLTGEGPSIEVIVT